MNSHGYRDPDSNEGLDTSDLTCTFFGFHDPLIMVGPRRELVTEIP